MRGVGTLSRLLGGGSSAEGWIPVPGVDEELRRLSQEERRRGARGGAGAAGAAERRGAAGEGGAAKRQRLAQEDRLLLTEAGLVRLVSAVVGRAEREAIGQALRAAEGGGLALEREPRNPADRHAILVVAMAAAAEAPQQHQEQQQEQEQTTQPLGYLPRTVAAYLAPMLDSGLLSVACVATSTTTTSSAAAVEVLLSDERRQWQHHRPLRADLRREVDAAIASCVAAGQRSLAPRGRAAAAGDGDEEKAGGGIGGGHAGAFQRMLDDVRRYDAHLLSEDELGVLSAIERLPLAPHRLLLRLLCRRPDPATGAPRWLPLGALKYDDVGDVARAGRALAGGAGAGGGGGGGDDCEEEEEEEEGGSGDDDGDPDLLSSQQQQQQKQQPPSPPPPPSPQLLHVWSASDADAWPSVLWSLSTAVLQAAALSVMPRGHPVLKPSTTKEPLVAALAAVARASIGSSGGGDNNNTNSSHVRLHRAIVAAAAGHVVRVDPRVHAAFRRLQRVYFLDEGLDLGIFMAAERGAVRYASYSVEQSRGGGGGDGGGGWAGAADDEGDGDDGHHHHHHPHHRFPAFPNRRALLEYEHALGRAAALEACLARDDLAGAAAALRPALEAVQQRGVHKSVVWSAAGGGAATATTMTMPNAPPAAAAAASAEAPALATAPPPPPPLFLARFSAAWVYTSMATVGVSLLEREKKHRQAVDLLQCLLGGNACPSRRGEWWARLSTNWETHLKQPEAALEVAEAALADDWVRHGDRLGLKRRVSRLCKPPRRWKRPAWAASVMLDPPERRISARPVCVVGLSSGGGEAAGAGVKIRYQCPQEEEDPGAPPTTLTVEELALRHYAREDEGRWRGLHCEGGIWGAFFALFFWDVLFCSQVPGVFRSPFQTAPLDLGTDAFFPARAERIQRRLEEVSEADADDLERTIVARWAAHAGTACRMISWSRWTCGDLVRIARCVGPLRLSVVLRLMVEDVGGAGMPDLLLYRESVGEGEGGGGNGGETGARMVEVKSQNDRLSDDQRMWLSALAAGGWDVEVLKVTNQTT
jgi:hypothetical protein